MTWAIRFDLPSHEVLYAGLHKGAWGWAHTIRTAELFDSPEAAGRVLANGYGHSAQYGVIVEVTTEKVET